MTKIPNRLHKYVPSMLLFLLFEAVAVTLWLTKDNFFYLLNFSYIGACLGLGTALFTAGKQVVPEPFDLHIFTGNHAKVQQHIAAHCQLDEMPKPIILETKSGSTPTISGPRT